jgi:translation initiation factor 3 subunit B
VVCLSEYFDVFRGGDTWKRFARFTHPNVKLIDFSPCEKYVVTWGVDPVEFNPGQFHNIAVWESSTGALLRSFAFDVSTIETDEKDVEILMREQKSPVQIVKAAWPLFKWSHDDKYLARISPNGISVYETPSMGLLDKTSIKVNFSLSNISKVANVEAIEWSPTDHILSFWTPELGDIPARLTLMELPSRNIIRKKNIFHVTDCKMHWQSAGEYLLVRVDIIKAKKAPGTNFEIFRLKEKNVPIDTMEIKSGETVTDVAWEPKGDRFIVTVNAAAKSTAYFHEMVVAGKEPTDTVEAVKLLRSVDAKGVNRIVWSPAGRFVVLASLGQGLLDFWDVEEGLLLGNGEHYMMSDVSWDPTGRYVVSYVSFWQVKSDNGFAMWGINGAPIYRVQIPQFKQVCHEFCV